MPVPTAAHAQWASQRWPGTDTIALQHGRTLYIDNCARCHNLYLPGAFTEKEWVDIMPKMKKKARITDTEADGILRYVLSSAAIQPLPVQQTIKTEQ